SANRPPNSCSRNRTTAPPGLMMPSCATSARPHQIEQEYLRGVGHAQAIDRGRVGVVEFPEHTHLPIACKVGVEVTQPIERRDARTILATHEHQTRRDEVG